MEKNPGPTPKSSPEPTSVGEDRRASFVRLLVVDEYEAFRRSVCLMLQNRLGFPIVGEASDGLEAVQKAEDLILLDLGLPKLNGIEAVRQIRKLAPESKILFLSLVSSPDVVQEALKSGAKGYVSKAKMGIDLLAAVEAVLDGRQFVSSGLERFGDYTWRSLSGHHVIPDGVFDQFGAAFGAKHFHHVVLVIGHRSGCHVQNVANFLHHLALGQQLQHFPLPFGQALVLPD
jgi:CheY-like chemotaxis protein